MAVPIERRAVPHTPPAIYDPEALLADSGLVGYVHDGESPSVVDGAVQDGSPDASQPDNQPEADVAALAEADRPDLEETLVHTLHAVLGKRREEEQESRRRATTLGRGSLDLVIKAKDRLSPRTSRITAGTSRR